MKRKNSTPPITKFYGQKVSKSIEGTSTPNPLVESNANPPLTQSSKPNSSPSVNTSHPQESHPSHSQESPQFNPSHPQESPRTNLPPPQESPQTNLSHPQESPQTNPSHPQESPQTYPSHPQESPQINLAHPQETSNDDRDQSSDHVDESHVERLTSCDVLALPQDPGKRKPIMSFHSDDRTLVRREYIRRNACQPHGHKFPQTYFGPKLRRFNHEWFKMYKWLEYSVEKDAAFCFPCYLFKDEISHAGGEAFVSGGFRSWNKIDGFHKHMGSHKSAHSQAVEKLKLFKKNHCSIISCFSKQSAKTKTSYDTRLEASIDALKYILLQGLPARGHDESEKSLNRGNFIQLLKLFGDRDENVKKVILDNAPKNCQLISSDIQKDNMNAFSTLTTRKIIKELNDDFFSILVDESADIVDKEQMSLCLRYVAKNGEVKERFLGIIHVADTKSETLKKAIEALLMQHSLTFSKVRGQGYDGASNMQGSINGLKTLIMEESPSAYFVHCFAHQLQLTLIAVAKKNEDCDWLFDMLATLLNVVGGSPKRKEILRQKQAEHVLEGLESGELGSGIGSNQEMSLSRPGDTRWGSHFKTVVHVLALYDSIMDVLDVVGGSENDKFKVEALVRALESFDFVFVAHLMVAIYSITNGLNVALQKKKVDIVATVHLVDACILQLKTLRASGWVSHMEKVTSFCSKHDVDVVDMDSIYVRPTKSKRSRGLSEVTNRHHFEVDVFNIVFDHQIVELNHRFNEKSKELLICMSCFSPRNHFSSFDPKKLVNLASKFYPEEFSSTQLMCLEYQLGNFINDVRGDERFLMINDLNEFSVKLVETNKHESHPEVYLLLKLVLILPVATASVERSFSAMTYIKNKLRNSMGDPLLNDCLVTFLERDLCLQIKNADVVNEFKKKPRRIL